MESTLEYDNDIQLNYSTWAYNVFTPINNNTSVIYITTDRYPNFNESDNQTKPTLIAWDDRTCDDGTTNDEDALSSTYFKSAVYLMYISIFLFALLGNGVVCYIVQSTPRMRTVTNYFIANLAVGDILMSLFCVPFSFVSIFILRYWPFGTVLCHLVNYSQAVSVLVSAYTLVAISVDRYIAIMWPLRPRITKRYAKCIIAVVWMIALLTALPIPIVSKLDHPDEWHQECGRYICREDWPSTVQNYYYTLALLTLQFVVPLLVLVFTYTRIAIAVWGKRPPGEAENSRDQRMARSKRKVFRTYFNLGFSSMKTDVCSDCVRLRQLINSGTDENLKKKNIILNMVHKARAKKFFQKLNEDPENTITINFDLMQN